MTWGCREITRSKLLQLWYGTPELAGMHQDIPSPEILHALLPCAPSTWTFKIQRPCVKTKAHSSIPKNIQAKSTARGTCWRFRSNDWHHANVTSVFRNYVKFASVYIREARLDGELNVRDKNKKTMKAYMVACAYNTSTRKVRTGESGVRGQAWLHGKFKASLSHMRACLRKRGKGI